jgi:hypothetical protein
VSAHRREHTQVRPYNSFLTSLSATWYKTDLLIKGAEFADKILAKEICCMKQDGFKKVLKASIERSLAVLASKAQDYAREADRLRNFKEAGALQNVTPEEARFGMLAKHIVSVSEMVEDLGQGRDWPMEVWQEKIGDSLNYFHLLEGLLAERYGWAE